MALLTQEERDQLLIRLDERVKAIKDGDKGDIPTIKDHLFTLNKQVSKNTTWVSAYKWILSSIGAALLAVLGYLIAG